MTDTADNADVSEPESGRLRGGFRIGDGLEPTSRALAYADSAVCCTGYDNRARTDPQSWLLDDDAFSGSITAVDRAPDGSIALFIEAVGDDATAGMTVRIDDDAAARIGDALLEVSDE